MNNLAIIPAPRSVRRMSGASSIGPDGLLVRFDNNNQDLCEKVDLFASDLRKQSIRTRRNTAQGYPLTLAIIESHDAKLGDEGYRLQTARDGAQVHANTNAGLFYGLQTFSQMLQRVGASWKIPHCRIVDRPALAMRGIHIDLKAQMLRFDYIMGMLHRCAQYKINTVLIEYEDKFPFRKHPRIVSPLALSRDEISQLVQTARTLNIRIIPKVQALAHAEYVLKHEQYNHLREHPDSPTDYCPLHPEYMPLIEDMFTEVIEAHRDSEYFHAGCDEPLLLGSCPKCKRRIAREGRGRFFADRLNRIHRLLESLGKKTIMWADRRLMYPEISPGLARDIVFMPWKYYDYSRLNDFSFYDHLVAQDMRGDCMFRRENPARFVDLSRLRKPKLHHDGLHHQGCRRCAPGHGCDLFFVGVQPGASREHVVWPAVRRRVCMVARHLIRRLQKAILPELLRRQR